MRIKSYLSRAVAALLLCAACGVVAAAQTAQATGTVTLKQPDGSTVPVQNAVVVFYRTDIKGRYETKTDKSGRYVYAALPYTGTYTIVVSAPNAKPTFQAGVPAGRRPENDFVLEPGDGSTLTLDQINAAMAASGGGGGAAAVDSAAAKRAREEYAKKVAAVEEENKKITATNAKLNELLKSGNAAFNAKNYDEAISFYDQGIQADPAQAVFYKNKSVALRIRGAEKFNAASRAKDTAAKAAARNDLKTSAELGDKAYTLHHESQTKSAAAGAAAAAGNTAQARSEDLDYLSSRAESYRIAMQAGATDVADAAAKAFQDYVNAETDPAKKAKAQVGLADALFQSNKVDESIAAYRSILAASPDNLDAMYGLGVALSAAASAVDPPNTAKMAEARDALQRFANKAPSTDTRKQEAESIAQGFDIQLKGGNKPAAPASTGKGRRKG